MNCKLALIFLVVLAVVLKSSEGKSIHEIKDDIKDIKKPLVVAKVGIAKIIAAKIKLAAFKKWAAIKTLAKAPFVLGKKVALLKVGALKSLAAFKAAKAKKALNSAVEKAAPAVAVVAGIPAKLAVIPAAVAGIPAKLAVIPAAVAGIPAAVAGIPAAAVAALKPKPASHSQVTHHTEVFDIYTYPGSEHHNQIAHPNLLNTHYSTYKSKSGLDAPRTYSNDYGLVPETEVGSQYYPVSDIIQPHITYGVPSN